MGYWQPPVRNPQKELGISLRPGLSYSSGLLVMGQAITPLATAAQAAQAQPLGLESFAFPKRAFSGTGIGDVVSSAHHRPGKCCRSSLHRLSTHRSFVMLTTARTAHPLPNTAPCWPCRWPDQIQYAQAEPNPTACPCP